jgi:TonB-dependent receptor
MKKRFILSIFILQQSLVVFGVGTIKGLVKDFETGESIVGCNVIIQGTSLGCITDIDGNYELKAIPDGVYNIIFSFISYEKNILKITVKGDEVILNADLKSSTNQIKDLVVTATRRTDTELSFLLESKLSLIPVNGITSQQIARSQDKDASEVIRRIPGVSIRDGKFVIVRGLTERYNSVWLNGASTPSSESDVRAFSFDVIPSGQIDNILIYKSPAPEFPADFAGAMINIKTKSLIDKNSVSFSYSYGYNQGSTGKDFFTYQGGKTDWLGFDDGTRAIPAAVPSTEEYQALLNKSKLLDEDKARITEISKSFNTIMTPYKTISKPDADFQFSLNKRFTLGSFSVGTVTALGYNSSNSSERSVKSDYINYTDTAYQFNQQSFVSKVRVTALSNWFFLFGNNQKIEFRNLFNNYGASKTVLKDGFDSYRENYDRAYEMSYETRSTYTGQIAGNHTFNNENSKFDWIAGYSFANKEQPDMRWFNSTLYMYGDLNANYVLNMSREVTLNSKGRMFLENKEHIWNGVANYAHKFNFNNFKPELKTGVYYEKKHRDVNSRAFGYIWKNNNYSLIEIPVMTYKDSAVFDERMFESIDDIFENKIDYKNGIIMGESTNKSNSYTADNELIAGYVGLNLPIKRYLNIYAGTRIEDNKLLLKGYDRQMLKDIEINHDDLDFFPSVNMTFNLSKEVLFRIAAGKSINRPEFREISPFTFYNFEERVLIYGNDSLRNAYINSYETRFEWYPTPEEIISISAFYKKFTDPIETHMIIQSGGNADFTYFNAEKALAYGVELDIRKRLHEFEKSALPFLSNFTFVINAALIKSIINVAESTTERSGERTMQGQSPYTINLGTYYNSQKEGLMVSLMYNKIGERIHAVGNVHHPHIYEMPFNSLDLTIEKKLFKFVSLKFGIKNLLDDEVVFNQTGELLDEEKNVVSTRTQVNHIFKPGRQFKFGINILL